MNTTTRSILDKRIMKITFLENENRQLMDMIEDMKTSLLINKGIIKNLVDQKKGSNAALDYTFSQLNHENEMLEQKIEKVVNERDALNARVLIQTQIIEDIKDKEEDFAEIYKDEIEELKENLERKEYLLQVNEQRYGEYEKILMVLADNDSNVRKKLNDLNLVPKDRKISNVILENTNWKLKIQDLQYENDKLRDQLEMAISQQ